MVAEGIGKSLGLVEKFMEQDGFARGGGVSYVQIRIRLDCNKPLC